MSKAAVQCGLANRPSTEHLSPPPPTTPLPQVNFVSKAANLYADAGYKLHGSSYVINKFLGTSWLWDRWAGQGWENST